MRAEPTEKYNLQDEPQQRRPPPMPAISLTKNDLAAGESLGLTVPDRLLALANEVIE
jgi:hypothetical protein